jgi:hypothetical protein
MTTATGTVLLIQEGRFRLLQDDGRGLSLVLAPSAELEPQDLAPLLHRRVRVTCTPAQGILAGAATRVEPV